ncbi:TPA: hypothetical protein ACH3X1_001290 [Trebouxia sp. C0004]
MHQPWKPCKGHAPSEKAVGDAANSRRHLPDDTSDDSDHGASHNKKEAGSVAGKQGKRKRGAAADSSSAGGRLPHGKKASVSLSRVFRISTIVPLLQQQWQEQIEGQHMLPDLGASAAASVWVTYVVLLARDLVGVSLLQGCNLVSLRLSSLPKSGQQRHTCCSVRQKRTSIAKNFSIKWCLGCWLLGQPWMGQHTSLQYLFCLWLGSQTVRQPSIKQCMLSRPCMVCGYYMVTSEKATFCVYPRQNKAARLYSLI